MDLKQLATLVAVADHGSFSGAAKSLFTVQSNVSAHIQRMEKELGVRLVDRSHGVLTEEGVVVAAGARRIQREMDAIHADLASFDDELAGEVRIGVIGTTARWLLPLVLNAVRLAHPMIHAVVLEASTSSLIPQLAGGQLDVAVLNYPLVHPDLVVDPLFDEDLVVLVHSGHPLADRTSIGMQELSQHQLVLGPRGTALRDDLDAEAAKVGVRLTPIAEIDGGRLVASLALEGYGVAVVPATAVPGWVRGDFARISVVGLPRRHVGVARRRRTVLAAPGQAVLAVLRQTIADKAPRQPGVHVSLALTTSA